MKRYSKQLSLSPRNFPHVCKDRINANLEILEEIKSGPFKYLLLRNFIKLYGTQYSKQT